MSRVDLHFANASCAHCVRLISLALRKLDGVTDIEVDPYNSRVVVRFDPELTSIDLIEATMEKSGYPTRPLPEKVIPFHLRATTGQAA